jgi:dTDP-4-dehydrorhamnose 3,5-epimerase
MIFTPTQLSGVWLVQLEVRTDDRGFFARTYCEDEFSQRGLNTHWPQCNLTLTRRRGMLRGLHFQAPPKPETKLIRCARGRIFDVLVDLRPESPTCGSWASFELSADAPASVYAPGGLAHGFQCLTDDCEIEYQMSVPYDAALARGVRWNDPQLKIPWPVADPILSKRDIELPLLSELR